MEKNCPNSRLHLHSNPGIGDRVITVTKPGCLHWIYSRLNNFLPKFYGNTDIQAEPHTGGRNMNGHFSTRLLNAGWHLAGSGPCLQLRCRSGSHRFANAPSSRVGVCFGLVQAAWKSLSSYTQFSNHGNEVIWVTIGNASTSEGVFWEAVNAIGVLHAPAVITIYDDGYGISVPNQFQMVKENIYSILKGFETGRMSG